MCVCVCVRMLARTCVHTHISAIVKTGLEKNGEAKLLKVLTNDSK